MLFISLAFKDGELWTVEMFLEKNEEACRLAALELNRKSQMVSEAVEEVLELVQNAAVTFRLIIGAENDVLAQGNQTLFTLSGLQG